MVIGIITGSGIDSLREIFDEVVELPEREVSFGDRLGRVCAKVLGRYTAKHGDTDVIIIPRHGKEINGQLERSAARLVQDRGHEGHIWYLGRDIGVDAIYSFSAVGAYDDIPLANTGTFAIPTGTHRGYGFGVVSFGIPHVELNVPMRKPFHPELRERLQQAVESSGYTAVTPATYICNAGDPFESPPETLVQEQQTRGLPSRLLGMTALYEAILCAQIGVPYATLCSVVNPAEGFSDGPVTHGETKRVMGEAAPMIKDITRALLESYA